MKSILTFTLIYLFSIGDGEYDGNKFKNPEAISIDMKGYVYVADTDNNRIVKLKEDGTLLRVIGGFGWGKEQFDTPIDICTKSLLDIFIADFNNQRIERYDKDLNYISSLYPLDYWDSNLTFGFPSAITNSLHGDLIIIDSENNRLLRINSFGIPELSFGNFASGFGKVDEPAQIDINSKDIMYVTDRSAGKIISYDYFGNYLDEIGSTVLKRPNGIFIDNNDNIWVTDLSLKEIFIFSPAGDLLGRVNRVNNEQNSFANPKDLVISDHRAYILDENKIHVFSIHTNQ